MVSLLEGCSEGCGWTAAIIAVVSWGTFGVPLKVNTNVEVNFFVMQSYKTIVCFVTSWLVILLGEPVRFTPWGIVSGLFWVPGASCGVYGIRNAGVAISVGTWSAIQVCTSFIFGIIIFQERVKDFKQTMLAFFILITGLVGMAMFSEAPTNKSSKSRGGNYEPLPTTESTVYSPPQSSLSTPLPKRHALGRKNSNGKLNVKLSQGTRINETHDISAAPTTIIESETGSLGGPLTVTIVKTAACGSMVPLEIESRLGEVKNEKSFDKDCVVLFGGRLSLTRRQLGIVGAVVNGAWGGFNLIPLHYAQRDQGLSGAGYLISYASGSMLVCLAIWAGLFLYHFTKRNYQWRDAIDQLPAWHVRELGLPGVLAGMFYSIGNFCSILAVTYLGQGVGFSFCQGQLLISGLWGVFFFGEIKGRDTIAKWFASAGVTVLGIIWLSYQHEGSPVHRMLPSMLGVGGSADT